VPQTTANTSRNPRPSPDSTGADNARPRHGKRRCELQATLRQTDAAIEAITCGEPAPYIELWDIDSEITLFGAWGPPCSTPSNGWRAASGPKGPHLRTHGRADGGSLAYTVGFERGTARIDGRAPVPMTPRSALWAFLRPMLSPRLAERHRDAFVFDDGDSSLDEHPATARRAASLKRSTAWIRLASATPCRA